MTRVLIVSDTRLYRDGLTQILTGGDGLRVVDAVRNGVDALAAVAEHTPDVVLLDRAVTDALGSISAIAQSFPEVRVVALGVPELESEVIACAEAGVAGFVPREGTLEQLVAAVEGAVRGELACSPRVAGELLRRVTTLASELSGQPEALYRLTPRETEIADLLEQGLSNKEIALKLGIEVSTVKNHVHNILDRLNVNRRGEAVARLRSTMPELFARRS